MNPPQFDKAMALLLQQLGMAPLEPRPQAYRLNFGEESPLYFSARPGGWLEIVTSIGAIGKDGAAAVAPALLALQLQQGDGALVCVGADGQSGKVSARIRLRLSDCHPDAMIAAVQALRAQAAAAGKLFDAQSAGTRMAARNAAHGRNALLRANSLRGLGNGCPSPAGVPPDQ